VSTTSGTDLLSYLIENRFLAARRVRQTLSDAFPFEPFSVEKGGAGAGVEA
jgi:hypothetical protein